jgi:hypothetical protein
MNWANGIRMMHNVMLLCKAENMINSLIDNGMSIYLKNPDGSRIKLQEGIELIAMQIFGEEEERWN